MEKTQAPGLTWRNGDPIWRATRAAKKVAFPSMWVNLRHFKNDPPALIARCHRLTAEMNEWLSGRRGRAVGLMARWAR
jgi:hypothetical protein